MCDVQIITDRLYTCERQSLVDQSCVPLPEVIGSRDKRQEPDNFAISEITNEKHILYTDAIRGAEASINCM